MTAEKIEITVKRPWLFRALLFVLGAGAGATGNEAAQPPAHIVTTEKIVVVEKPTFIKVPCPDVNVNISRDIPAAIKKAGK